MAILQRLIGGIAWIALTAVGLYMWRPMLFPDFTMPAQIAPVVTPIIWALWAADPRHLIGLMITLVAVAIGLVNLRGAFSRKRSRSVYASPVLGAPEPVRPKPSSPSPSTSPSPKPLAERSASPASLRLVEPIAAPKAEAEPVVITPTVAHDRSALLSELRAGDAAADRNRTEEAVEHYSAALEIARGLQASAPDSITARIDLADALTRLAGQEEAEGRVDPAIGLYEEAVELRRSLAMAAPEDADQAKALAGVLSHLADCREVRGHTSRARDLYAEVVGITERLSWLQPDDEARRDAILTAKARLEALKAELKPGE